VYLLWVKILTCLLHIQICTNVINYSVWIHYFELYRY
jgi:hypothetical protein